MSTLKVLGILALVLIASVIIYTCNTGARVVDKFVTNSVDNSVSSYEEYQNLYNACVKINTDLGNMESMPDDDVSFAQFSKAQRINTLKTSLNRWVEEYNAKSKMKNKSLWKSSTLPYQLDVNSFSNYNYQQPQKQKTK